jgi:uncharacterized protein DUF6938
MSDKGKAWVISVDMGYGHDRAAYPLKDIAHKRIIEANNDKIISYKEQKIWHRSRIFYEFVSRLRNMPLIGKIAFNIYDHLQSISPFFPFRDLSKSDFIVMKLRNMIKKGFGKDLIDYVKKTDIPFVTSHFIPAMMAHYNGLENIYCIATDTDLNRVWVPHDPKKCNIKYLAPCEHVVYRLKEYGIDEKNIILTGFPLPKKNLGGPSLETLKKDFAVRLINLDPKSRFIKRNLAEIKSKLGKYYTTKKKRILTLTYMVGGAGAEKEIGIQIIESLRNKIKKKQIKVNLVAGSRLDVHSYFLNRIKEIGMDKYLDKGINIVYYLGRNFYFEKINDVFRNTDILWTKPSEMSFYAGLALPIIIAPPLGAHENFNKQWLEHLGAGTLQEDPLHTEDWLFYWLEKGRFADAAWQGFLEAPNQGTYNIEKIVK